MSTLPATALIFHQTSTAVAVGLFQDNVIVDQVVIPYRDASKELIPAVDGILKAASSSLADISYIGCTIGPAPFTTLRTLVVTVNGLGFATGIPLVGVNGLVCLAQEAHRPLYQRTYAINNAFGNEVYCAVYDPMEHYLNCHTLSLGDAIDTIASYAHQHPHVKIQIVGNALNLLPDSAPGFVGQRADISEKTISHASLEALAAAASTAWNAGEAVSELKPYYGKNGFTIN